MDLTPYMAIGGSLLNVYNASQYGKGFETTSQVPMTPGQTALKNKAYAKADRNYSMASVGIDENNLAAPIIAGLKTQNQMARKASMDALYAGGAGYGNTDEFMGQSSLSKLAVASNLENARRESLPTGKKNESKIGNFQAAMGTNNAIYGLETKQSLANYQAKLNKYMKHQKKSSFMGSALGGLAGLGFGLATGGLGFGLFAGGLGGIGGGMIEGMAK